MLVCGIDEVGRGALAGPILAACALFKFDDAVNMKTPPIVGLADSKSFATERKREAVWETILRSPHLLDFGIGECSVEEINECGIEWCNRTIFQRAIICMKHAPDIIYVDGDNPIVGWPQEKQIVEPKADAKYWPVSAASIIAKVIRDRLMNELDRLTPGYAWHSNKGYGSTLHQMRLKLNGPSEQHRKHFVRKILNRKAFSDQSGDQPRMKQT
jgi:ribonuclease HII